MNKHCANVFFFFKNRNGIEISMAFVLGENCFKKAKSNVLSNNLTQNLPLKIVYQEISNPFLIIASRETAKYITI